MADRRVLRTWSQMEVRAVMRYEWTRGTSILDIHRRLQSVYGDDVMSHQMAGRSCSMFSGRRQTWIWKDAQIGLHLPHSATHPLRAHDNMHFFSLVQVSIQKRRVLRTWTQMEACFYSKIRVQNIGK
ncbi:hypothetical protein AVEN_221133-1 [Araneus ventricosus]|uniref:Mos1 transposase HTH domain-containing protein n=1 Tax=Araneus ventricosus TaxID=182803 RepID=A0A4Y2C5E1_ARAVE|nr:hypothetical protein AVEN_221133-1 [Araneus ventricosus]